MGWFPWFLRLHPPPPPPARSQGAQLSCNDSVHVKWEPGVNASSHPVVRLSQGRGLQETHFQGWGDEGQRNSKTAATRRSNGECAMETSRDTLSKSRSWVLLSRDGLVLFLFSKQGIWWALPGAGCPHHSTLTLFSKGVYIRKSLGFFPWEIKYKLCI